MKNSTQQGFTAFDELPEIDPAVDSLIGQGQRRQAESHLAHKERSRKKKERARAEKRIPNRIGLDIPVDLKRRLEVLAKEESVPISQLVAFLLYEQVRRLETKQISLWGYKIASSSPKYDSILDLERWRNEVSRNE